MIPLDGSATAERGLREAIALAGSQTEPAVLHLLHVVDIAPLLMDMAVTVGSEDVISGLRQTGRDMLATAKGRIDEVGIRTETALRETSHGSVAELIVDEVRKTGCDLIVMGTHGRSGLRRLALGSDAEKVVRTSSTPVLLVRGDTPPA